MGRPLKPPKKEPVFLPSTFAAPSREELLEDVQAFEARSEYVRQEATTVTLASLRRILEKDLNVETGFLETYKEFVTGLIKELLQGPEEQSPETWKVSDEHDKGKEKVIEEAESEAMQEDVPKPNMKRLKKKADSEGMNKDEVIQMPLPVVNEDQFKRRTGCSEGMKDEILNSENPENAESPENVESPENEEPAHTAFCEEPVTEPNEKGHSSAEESDDEKPERKVSKSKVVESKPIYSRKVELLKNIIKDCSITVPPSVYKIAKQAGESRQEGIMIAELEAILRKEGLTASVSKDEIKAVRKRKEELKDLEGIDTSSIIDELRGRRSRTSANSFFAPLKKYFLLVFWIFMVTPCSAKLTGDPLQKAFSTIAMVTIIGLLFFLVALAIWWYWAQILFFLGSLFESYVDSFRNGIGPTPGFQGLGLSLGLGPKVRQHIADKMFMTT